MGRLLQSPQKSLNYMIEHHCHSLWQLISFTHVYINYSHIILLYITWNVLLLKKIPRSSCLIMAQQGTGWYPLLLGVIVSLASCVLEKGEAVNEQSDAIAVCKEQCITGYGYPGSCESYTACDVQCPVQCNCSLGNFSNVVVKCNSGVVIVSSVVYSSNVTTLFWDDCGLSAIHGDSFSAVADVLTYLSLHNNSLHHLQVGVFERLVDLKSLWLSLNLLRELEPGIFSGLSSLSHLYLDGNLLAALKSGVFDEMENLTSLQLQYNLLKEIQVGVFRGLFYLTHLYMYNNMLTTIVPEVFKDLKSLFILDLDSNMLILNHSMFAGLDSLGHLYLRNNSLKHLQPDNRSDELPEALNHMTNMSILTLNDNKIKYIKAGVFKDMEQVKILDLGANMLEVIEPGSFDGLANLQVLKINHNKLVEIPAVLNHMTNLVSLTLNDNKINYIKPGIFKDVKQLGNLVLGGNMLEHIEPGTFKDLANLQGLNISHNKLTEIHPELLNHMNNLSFLSLSNNQLGSLDPDIFKNFRHMLRLHLSNINMQILPKGICKDMPLLEVINISGNGLNELGSQAFQTCYRLNTLDITENSLQWIESDSFDDLQNGSHVLVDTFSTCCFVKKALCHPHSPRSPFLTCGRLLPTTILRIGIWVVSVLAVFANVGGSFVRHKHRRKINTIQYLLITNLSISDFLMGIYLIILLSADIYYTDYFPSHSDLWRNSALCKIAGSLSVLSSEASVFFITLISIDRFMKVKFPTSIHLISATSIIVVITVIWFVAFGISIISFIISDVDSTLYTVSEICVGLPLSRHYLYTLKVLDEYEILPEGENLEKLGEAWIYHVNEITDSEVSMYFSIVIFTVINLGCFLVVGLCYVAIFIIIRKSSKKSGLGKISKNEIRMAKKLSLIVLTDCCCWVPIGVLSIIVQAGGIEIHPVAYAWIATFVLPINSAMNPFLYTVGDAIAYRKITCFGCRNQKENENVQMQHYTRPTAINRLQENPQ